MPYTKETFASRVRVGFELETQSSNDTGYWDSGIQDCLDKANEKLDKSEDSWLEHCDAPDSVKQWLKANKFKPDNEYMDKLSYKVAKADIVRNLGSAFDFDGQLEIGEDGSVDGFEFRTVGANTVPQALDALEKLFKISHRVDVGCGFHIHVSFDDRKNKYSKYFQARLINGVINRLSMLPDSVINRFGDGYTLDRWAYLRLDTYKGAFASYRGKTWEFRGFGNISTKADAEACLTVALEAFRDALNSKGPSTFDAKKAKDAIAAEYSKRFNKGKKAA